MANFFNTILYQPLFNALVFLYNNIAFQDLGVAIIMLTVVIRVILYPLFYHSFKNQTMMQQLQPRIQKIQHEHKGNREKQAQELMALYKQNKINPFSGFLLILVQLPILIALYQLFLNGFSPEAFDNLYSFISIPDQLNNSLLGLIDLQSRSILIVVLAAIFQYFQGKLALPKTNKDDKSPTAKVGRSMVIIGPVITLLILTALPAAVGVYWMASSAFSIGQQLIINKQLAKSNKSRHGSNESKEGGIPPAAGQPKKDERAISGTSEKNS